MLSISTYEMFIRSNGTQKLKIVTDGCIVVLDRDCGEVIN